MARQFPPQSQRGTESAASLTYREARTQEALENLLQEETHSAPSLPIILFSAAAGLAAAISIFFVAWEIIALRLEWSVVLSVLALCFALGGSGALLSAATRSRAALPNIGFSCALIVLAFIFFAFCLLAGALGGTFLITLSG